MIPLKDGDLMLNLHSESQGRILSLKSSHWLLHREHSIKKAQYFGKLA